ncbi:MAG: phage holin family protein [Clostridia bacterium]|nr:phage holin family protein [Eubacteriales bacterium]MDD3867918.1 phage holin family protein [Eubacteriales bacterium]NCC48769.1 phage holin family protein [Clostridia bacterium]
MKIAIRLLSCLLAILLMSEVLPEHIQYESLAALIAAGTILWLANSVIRPLIKLITLPLTILTLGLFSLVVNALMVMLTDLIVPGISFGNFWSSLALALVVSLIQVILGRVFKED